MAAQNNRTRQQICREAARLMVEEGLPDHQSAKSKAIERLNLPANSELPDNREIESALIDYLELFQAKQLAERKTQWRKAALSAMGQLQEYNPQLIGPALSGVITRYSSVQILVQVSPEILSIVLHDENLEYDQEQKRFRRTTKEAVYLPTFQLQMDGLDIELICAESDAITRTLVCPVTGKALKKGSYNDIRKLLEN